MLKSQRTFFHVSLVVAGVIISDIPALADTVLTTQDGIIRNNLCVGADCLDNETFSDELVLKSSSPSLRLNITGNSPHVDWRLGHVQVIYSYGSTLALGLSTPSTSQIPFLVDASAKTATLVLFGNSVGIGVIPDAVTRLHMRDNDTPTLRLEQPGSGGFDRQIWDVAGNDINFIVRDATNESLLPFRIFAGAPTNALTVKGTSGNVGIGVKFADAALHVRRSNGSTRVRIEETSPTLDNNRILLELINKGASQIRFEDSDSGTDWRIQSFANSFRITRAGTGVGEFSLDGAGNATIQGVLTQNSDKNAKTAVEPLDPAAILAKVAALPVAEWSYIDTEGVRHIGPMAQDFHALFGLGATETGISTLDTSGVALAAIQALDAENVALKAKLVERDAAQRALVGDLTARLEALENARK